MIKRFLIYGLFGWSIEIIWTGLSSMISGNIKLEAFTSLWMFFIYGLAVFLEPIHHVIEKWSWIIRGVLWVVIIWGIEYTSGFIFTQVLGIYPWFYSGQFSIDGLVRLDYGPAWFIAGFVFERIHRTLDAYNIA